jgi:polygalacturonase
MLVPMKIARTLGILALLAPVVSLAAGRVHNVLDYGAKPDGTTLSTASIQKAIDDCAAGGGGTVRIPAGRFLSGALRMKSRVTFLLEKGATLLGSRNREDYHGPRFDGQGREVTGSGTYRHLLNGIGLHDIAIRGAGTIDGNGSAFRDKTKHRTKAIYLETCRNVLIEGVTMRSAGSWMQHYRLCEKLTIRGIEVFNHVAFNNDGLNVDSCRNVAIKDCRVHSDDDGIVLKSLSQEPCRNVTITNCTVSSHCNALKMGTESGGGFLDIAISNCRVFSPARR